MPTDLKQLAVQRGEPGGRSVEPSRHIASRYVLPGILIVGFILMLAWAARDAFLPRTPVTVVPVLVSLAELQEAGTPLFKAAGWVEPRPTPIRVAALAEGVIDRLLVVEDQLLKKGEPIAYLVDDDARLSLESAQAAVSLRDAEFEQCQAALTAARQNYDEPTHLQTSAAAAEAELAKVETALTDLPFQTEAAEARFRLAEADLKGRIDAGDAVSGIELVAARTTRDAAKAQLQEMTNRRPSLESERAALAGKRDAARRRLELKTDEKRTLDESKALLDVALARREQARVAVAEAQLRFDRMTIRAPVDARVLHLLTSPGTHLSGGQGRMGEHDGGVVVTLYQPQQLQVRVDVRFEDLPRTGREQPVLVESPAVSEPMLGRVLFSTGFADIQKNTLSVKVLIDDPPEVLKPDMLVDVTFLSPDVDEGQETGDGSDDLRVFVPRELIRQDGADSYVWLADLAASVARRQSVVVAKNTAGRFVEVTSGLSVASRLISSDVDSLNDGDRITAREGQSAGSDRGLLPVSKPDAG
jgi:multidrug efflux pump subunit AcrA (membrane-fusion protein)